MVDRRALAASAMALWFLACTGPASQIRVDPPPTTGWLEIRTPDFAVFGNLPATELQRLASELARFEAVVARVTNAPRGALRVPMRLFVFQSAAQARKVIGIDWAAGVLIQTLPGYFAILSADAPHFETRNVLFHEYVHYVLHKSRRIAYPLWYDEGLSEYLAATRFRRDAIIIGAPPTARLRALARSGPLPLEVLFGLDETTRVDLGLFYATAWAIVHYLNASEPGRSRLSEYATRLVHGEDWRSAYGASFEETLEELDAALERHVEALSRGARIEYDLHADSLKVSDQSSERPVPPAAIAYQLGSLARSRWEETASAEQLAMARALFENAIEHDSAHARVRAALAWVRAVDEQWDESGTLLARALREASSDAPVMLELGRVEALRARAEAANGPHTKAARIALERAVELAPEQPEGHAVLARFYADTAQDARGAIASFERARALGAWSPSLEVELAQQYVAIGERAVAMALLRPVAADRHGGRSAKEARRLLKSLRGAEPGSALPAPAQVRAAPSSSRLIN